MTDETMPRELMVEPDGDDIIIHTGQDLINNPACQKYLHKYIHYTTHQQVLDALEVARRVLADDHAVFERLRRGKPDNHIYHLLDKNCCKALTQINQIIGGEDGE